MNKVSEVSAQVKRNEAEYNRIWNAAIEECCNYLKSKADHSTIVSMLRKLKK